MELNELLLSKLFEGYLIKFCMNSMRVKMCSIRKGSEVESWCTVGTGDGATALQALEQALRSFAQGYVSSGYSTGDTETYNLLEKFVHSGYNVHLWVDSGLAITQVRHDTLCSIPAGVLLRIEAGETLVSWTDLKGRKCETSVGSLDIMRHVDWPNLRTYKTRTLEGVARWESSEHHHVFKQISDEVNFLEGMFGRRSLLGPGSV